ncbi:MAG: GNAT family N-acetyltransferase [Propionibacteriaceae bacterium]|nr:GNAT family N-acetyltransferase [Propionibacteriaceae bacterium]
MIVRDATPADLDAIMALEDEAFAPGERWSRASWQQELAPGRCCLVGVSGDVIGVAAFSVVDSVADLNRIIVAARQRGRRRAGELLASGLERVAERGAVRTLLEVKHDNHSALRLYARHGFTEIARRRDYYGPGADALILEVTHV